MISKIFLKDNINHNKKINIKKAYKGICLIFSWLSSFYSPNKITELNELSKKSKSLIDPKFLLTFQSLFLVDRFGFNFEANSPWDHAFALYEFNFRKNYSELDIKFYETFTPKKTKIFARFSDFPKIRYFL